MNPKHPLDAGLAERLWLIGVNAIWISFGRPKSSPMKNQNYRDTPFYDKAAFDAVAEEVRKIVTEAKEGKMTKYPKAVWVGFDGELFPWNVWKSKPVKMPLGVTGKRYHLHPGNEVAKERGEVARALNILQMHGHLIGASCEFIAAKLRRVGFRVWWRNGRFL